MRPNQQEVDQEPDILESLDMSDDYEYDTHDPDDNEDLMSDEDIVTICTNELSLSAGYVEDELSANQKEAMDYFFGRPNGKEKEGRSDAISMDVADMVEATLAEIMPLYASPRIAQFNPVHEGDEKQARLESNYCNYVLMEENEGYIAIYQAVKDALLQKMGLLEIYTDERIVPSIKEYNGLNEFELLSVMQPKDNNETREAIDFNIDEENGTVDIKIKILKTVKEIKIEPFAPEDFRFSTSHRSPTPDGLNFSARRMILRASDLASQGIDKKIIDQLQTYDSDTTTTQQSRNQIADETEFYSFENATRPIEVYKCFVMLDYDKDGIAELHEVRISGNTLIERKQVDRVPFALGTPFIMSHRMIGESLFDKIKATQDDKTVFLRQWQDNADHMNNRRLEVVANQVNLEDVLNSRPGGVVRTKSKGVVNPIPVDDIGPSCQNALNYLDQIRSERGGASLDMQTQSLKVGAETAHGVERQYTSKEKMSAFISRTIAETLIKQTYILIHATLRDDFTEEYPILVGGVWVKAAPATWIERKRIKVDVGMSAGERAKKVQSLSSTLELQLKALELDADEVLTNKEKIYNTLIDMSDSGGIDNPERYWIDPTSPKAIEALQKKQAAAQAQQKALQEQAKMVFEYQKTIEDQKDQLVIMKEENKKLSRIQDWANKFIMHDDKIKQSYVELGLEYDVNLRSIEGKQHGQ